MSGLENVVSIDSTTTLSDNDSIYLVNASTTNITITLPLITADGIKYKLIRIDTSSNIVTVERSGTDLIYTELNTAVTSINLDVQRIMELRSFENNWYITAGSSIINRAYKDEQIIEATNSINISTSNFVTITPQLTTNNTSNLDYYIVFTTVFTANANAEFEIRVDGVTVSTITNSFIRFSPSTIINFSAYRINVGNGVLIQIRARRTVSSGSFTLGKRALFILGL